MIELLLNRFCSYSLFFIVTVYIQTYIHSCVSIRMLQIAKFMAKIFLNTNADFVAVSFVSLILLNYLSFIIWLSVLT